MTADQTANLAISWMRKAILIALLVMLAVILLRAFGVSVPIRTPEPIALAYLSGAFWLLK